MSNELQNRIIIYEGDDGHSRIEVHFSGETVWLTQAQLAELFKSSKANVSEHIKHIFDEKELEKDSVVRKFRTTASDGKNYDVEHYNLDLIISLGYRIKSQIATKFRIWATERLREYLTQGFTINDEFLKNNGGGEYFKKLLARIRDIRSSEKVLYRQVLDLYATSADYDPKSLHSLKFFKMVQNKLHYAVHKRTAAEIIYDRADSKKEFMGLTVFAGDLPTLEEVRIAKNYLTIEELEKLNRLVSAYFELTELRAMKRQTMSMAEHIKTLDRLLSDYGEGVLIDAGNISHEQAMEKAEKEYRKYQVKTLSKGEKDYLAVIKAVEKKIAKNVKIKPDKPKKK